MKSAKPLPECQSREDFNKPLAIHHYEVIDFVGSNLPLVSYKLCILQDKCLELNISPLDVKAYRILSTPLGRFQSIELKLSEFAFPSTVIDKVGPFYIEREAWSWTPDDCDDYIHYEHNIKHLSLIDKIINHFKSLYSNK